MWRVRVGGEDEGRCGCDGMSLHKPHLMVPFTGGCL